MQPQMGPTSSWSGKPVPEPSAPQSRIITFGSFPGVPVYPRGAVDPNSLIGTVHVTFGPASPQDSYVVVTPMCKTTAPQPSGESRLQPSVTISEMPAETQAALDSQDAYYVVTPMCKSGVTQPAEHSCPDSSSTDAASIAYDSTPSPSICRRPSDVSVGRQDKPPLYPSASRPQLQLPSHQATEAEATGCAERPIGSVHSLLLALKAAKTSEVPSLMELLTFTPQAPAFTKMLKECGSDVPKVLEVWQAMKRMPYVEPNAISYSVIIRIIGDAGYWTQVEKLFQEQLKDAETDIYCQPSLTSYRRLVSALLRGGQGEQAMQWLRHLKTSNITADAPFYDHIIRVALLVKADKSHLAAIFCQMHDQNLTASSGTYNLAVQFVYEEGDLQFAEALFVLATKRAADLTPHIYHNLMAMYDKAGAVEQAKALLIYFMQQGYSLEEEAALAYHAQQIFARLGNHQKAAELWHQFWVPREMATQHIASVVFAAYKTAGMEPFHGLLW